MLVVGLVIVGAQSQVTRPVARIRLVGYASFQQQECGGSNPAASHSLFLILPRLVHSGMYLFPMFWLPTVPATKLPRPCNGA